MSTEKKKICHNRTIANDKQLGACQITFFISFLYLKLFIVTNPALYIDINIHLQPDLQSCKQFGAHLRQLGPVKRFVAVEELSSQVTVLPVELLQRHNVTFMDKDQLFGSQSGKPFLVVNITNKC